MMKYPSNILELASAVDERLTVTDELIQLAEECAELSQAALKLARIMIGHNSTPVRTQDALAALHEEVNDVYVSLAVLGILPRADTMEARLYRWLERLGER